MICAWKNEWNELPMAEQAERNSRQGVRYHVLDSLQVMDPQTMTPVPNDGETLGEAMFRGNIVMKGYLKNPAATEEALAGGWFHSGDLGVVHPDGYIQLKDRSKDIIIFGRREHLVHRGWRTRCTAIPRCSKPRWSPAPTRSGARRRARS